MRAITAAVTVLALTACGSKPAMEPQALRVTQCTDPRPQVCTMEYNPVCATLVSVGTKQYASPCNACADDTVLAYLEQPCTDAQ